MNTLYFDTPAIDMIDYGDDTDSTQLWMEQWNNTTSCDWQDDETDGDY
jgi:hypothetical protein